MTDREKVIKGLDCCASGFLCSKCPYDEKGYDWTDCVRPLAHDALVVLEEQKPVEPVEMIEDFYPIGDSLRTIGWRCGICGERIAGHDNFCPNCGRAVKWDGI